MSDKIIPILGMKEGMKLKFKALHIIIEGHSSIYDDVKKIISFGKNKYEHNNEVFLIEKKIVDNRYLWMYCQYENSKLYGEIVLDTEKEKQHKNTRKKNEIELRKQLFLILDTESHLLYLSDIAKKGAIKTYFSEELQADIIIKNLYSSLDEFQKSVKILKKFQIFFIIFPLPKSSKSSLLNPAISFLKLPKSADVSKKASSGSTSLQ